MGFFDNFKLLNKKSGYVVRYKDSTLATVKPDVLKRIVLDHLTKGFITEITKLGVQPSNPKKDLAAMKLMAVYNKKRKEFYSNPRLKDIKANSPHFKFFVQAAKLVETHNITPAKFIDAQVLGLAFVNEGAGTYPKPSQLITLQAEERVLKVTTEWSTKNNKDSVVRLELNRSDKETELMQNPRFKSRYTKMENKTATLQDVYFVNDCMLARKGRVSRFVRDYLDELEGNGMDDNFE